MLETRPLCLGQSFRSGRLAGAVRTFPPGGPLCPKLSVRTLPPEPNPQGRQGKTALGYYRVHYLDDGVGAKTGMNWEQSLLVSDYGPDKKWIAIKKMTKSEQKEAQKGVEQEVEQQEQGASSSTDALEVMATPEPMSVEGSGAASSSSSASSSNQKRIAELSDEE